MCECILSACVTLDKDKDNFPTQTRPPNSDTVPFQQTPKVKTVTKSARSRDLLTQILKVT